MVKKVPDSEEDRWLKHYVHLDAIEKRQQYLEEFVEETRNIMAKQSSELVKIVQEFIASKEIQQEGTQTPKVETMSEQLVEYKDAKSIDLKEVGKSVAAVAGGFALGAVGAKIMINRNKHRKALAAPIASGK